VSTDKDKQPMRDNGKMLATLEVRVENQEDREGRVI
jgi:hypothetical protein